MAIDGKPFAALLPRTLIALGGNPGEQEDFLQSLLTNDVSRAAPDALVYAGLLTPQGKFLADFLIHRSAEGNFLLDIHETLADKTVKRLGMYRLRRPVTLETRDAPVVAVWGGDEPPEGALRDPRHPALGWRLYRDTPEIPAQGDYERHRIMLGIPEAPQDLIEGETFILEAGFEAMQGVDFRKGCYVGQEIVARMKHKTELRKGYRAVTVEGTAPPGSALLNAEGKSAGTLLSHRDGNGIALLRLDRAQGVLATEDGSAQATTS